MKGEDVYGCKIDTSMEGPSPPQRSMVGRPAGNVLPPPVLTHPSGPMPLLPPPVSQFPLPPRGPPHPPPLMSICRPPPSMPPPPGPLPHFPTPPSGNPQFLPTGSVPRPDWKILIFKIPSSDEPGLLRIIRLVVLQENAMLSAEVVVLWHRYAELQVLLRLDSTQTAILRKETSIPTLDQTGQLKAEVRELHAWVSPCFSPRNLQSAFLS